MQGSGFGLWGLGLGFGSRVSKPSLSMQAPDLDAILVAGHSMGGHGALPLVTKYVTLESSLGCRVSGRRHVRGFFASEGPLGTHFILINSTGEAYPNSIMLRSC